jgi:long-subunit fatty acid transport protein
VAYVHEWWSAHDSIQLDPKDVKLVGITGFPSPYAVGAVRLPRNFRNTSSFRIGAEYRLPLGEHALTLRTGGYYEPSAIPPSHLSVLTIDLDKVVGSLGASFGLGSHWRFDATYAHVFSRSVTVPADVAQVPLINPVQGNPTDTYAVNGGRYAVDSNVFGLGVMYTF